MPAEPEENLDDVIADLVDGDDEYTDSDTGVTSFDEIKTSENIDIEGPAVQLTERAAKQVRKIKEAESLGDDLYLRVAVEGGGCSGLSYKLGFDYQTDEDDVIVSRGIEILVDPRHMMYLKGISIDYPDGLDARGFTFENPNAEETCGCGTSFAT